MLQPKQDTQTVTPLGERVAPRIAGVNLRAAITHQDDRGEVCEIFNAAWSFDDAPMTYVYQIVIRPRRVKGWVVHRDQDDRLFASLGIVKIVLFDDRPGSATYRMINEIYLGERNRALIAVPAGVFHAIQNVGEIDAVLINLPTRPYNHAVPDKFRLPLDTDQIPYRFDVGPVR
jgi:dTDP-4-dehydrorhamnose 3,5-epimerase